MSTLTDTTTSAELAVRLRRTVVRLSRRLRRQAASGLSPSLESALGLIGRLTPSELAEAEEVRRPTATRLIAILERRNLVERAADPYDGRSHRVAVTHAGRALLAESRTRRDAYLGRALSALRPDELAALDRALALLERLVEESR
jgi:DNA-binding MarR family transcriptional regulator